MGNTNSSTRESRTTASRSRAATANNGSSSNGANDNTMYSVRSGRTSRQNLSFLHLGSSSRGDQSRTEEPRRETKQEREARKREKERLARDNERERSMKEENVDGGYLVTLGTYVGPEDFNKTVVRQLMIERRLAPFWKGLNDHSDSWTENQLVAVARGLALPAPDDPPLPDPEVPTGSDLDSLTIPISSRSQSYQSDHTSTPQSATFPRPGTASLPSASGSRGLFRDRAKTLASLGTSNKNNNASSTSIAPQEIQLPRDPRVNGSPLEAVLYKDAAECPICFMYYPPHLNKTRCCDQPICSECFVQIKRPDPHPPEHHDDEGNPTTDEEGLLVSEPAACPFCVTPEFGVSYQPPSFRRGLVFSGPVSSPAPTSNPSPDASTLSLAVPNGRRRTTSLSASAPTVISTDRVRPDWAKKLADARAHALRRSAAATALHNAAYMLGSQQPSDSRSFGGLGRRRRTLMADASASASGAGTPRPGDNGQVGTLSDLIAHIEGSGASTEPRPTGRRSRAHDLEDLMMMEAIRLSLASEEDRKKKEEKEVRKEAKRREKESAKEAKKAEKVARKTGSLYSASLNGSTVAWSDMTRSTSNIPRPQTALSTTSSPPPPAPQVAGKGKAPATAAYGFNPLSEPTSTLNTEVAEQTAGSQRHLEESRANMPQTTQPISFPETLHNRSHLRHISNASSAASSMLDSAPGSYQRTPNHQMSHNASATVLDDGTGTPDTQSGTPNNDVNTESMFNFNSLTEMIRNDDKDRDADHVEFFEQKPEEKERNSSVASSSKVDAISGLPRLSEDERESVRHGDAVQVHDQTTPKMKQSETKHAGDVNILNGTRMSTK
ncbi:hypothetical protein E4T47_04754 [Aureobasidium subglaciale]|nr:hypothetical protein E4T47_04754 [Aureobasidium subglaciale]